MRHHFAGLVLACALAVPALPQTSSPFVGRWDFNVTTPAGQRANWLGITEHGDKLDIWFQPTGGHVFQLKDFHVDGFWWALLFSLLLSVVTSVLYKEKRKEKE